MQSYCPLCCCDYAIVQSGVTVIYVHDGKSLSCAFSCCCCRRCYCRCRRGGSGGGGGGGGGGVWGFLFAFVVCNIVPPFRF